MKVLKKQFLPFIFYICIFSINRNSFKYYYCKKNSKPIKDVNKVAEKWHQEI